MSYDWNRGLLLRLDSRRLDVYCYLFLLQNACIFTIIIEKSEAWKKNIGKD